MDWGGASFRYIDDDALYTHDGRQIGFVDADDPDDILIFSVSDGRYLGELLDSDRLITREARLLRHRRPRRQRDVLDVRGDRVGSELLVGCVGAMWTLQHLNSSNY